VVTFVSSIVAMIIISWPLTIVSVFTVPAFFWLTRAVGQRRRRVSKSTQESLAAMSALTEETLSVSGVLLAKVFGNQARDIGRYRQESQRLADLEVRQNMIGQGFYAALYQEQFDGGKVQWRCPDGDVLADGTVRQRVPA
jgi:ATP-binding cassette, subfamily B, bacterial